MAEPLVVRKEDALCQDCLGKGEGLALSPLTNAGPGSYGEAVLALEQDGMLSCQFDGGYRLFALTEKGRIARAMLVSQPTQA